MSKIKLTGENSGYVEISAGQNAGNNTLETPTSGTRLVAHEGSQDVILNANLTVNGVLTYDDVTNIDSVGVITARNGLHVTTGSVGIGTDNPATNFKLDVNGDLSLGELGGSDNTYIDQKQNGQLNIINSGRQANSGGVRINKTNSIGGDTTYFRDFEVYDGKDELLFLIDGSSGNIGIGTDDPDELLEVGDGTVSGALKVSGQSSSVTSDGFTVDWESSSNSTRFFSEPSSGGSSAIRFFVTHSGTRNERLRIQSNGKVGIDSTTPHRQLVVGNGGDISCFGTNGGIYFGTSTGGFRNNGAIARAAQAGYHVSGSQVGDLVMAPEADKDLIISSGSTNTMYERLRVTTGGNIGINKSNPTQKLFVGGNISIQESGNLYFDATSGFSPRITNSASINDLSIFTNNTERLRIASDGTIRVVADNQKLTLGAGNDFELYHDGSNNVIATDGPNIRIGTTGENFARFVNNGAVELYHDNTKRFETTSAGATITNDLVLNHASGDKAIRWATGGTNKWSLYHNNGAGALVAYDNANNAERLRIDSNGNLGVNKSPETDWATSYRAIEIGNSSVSAYQGGSYPSIELNMNCRGTQASYGAGWKYILGMRATQIHLPYSGETIFRRATSGSVDGAISWNESMRISNDGSLYHRGNNSSTINNTDGDGQASSGYPAGGATFNKNISVNNNASAFGQCMNMLSHTKSVTLNGSTNYEMVTIWNREGCFIGHVYAGFSTGGDGAVAMYKFNTFYSANSIIAELGPSGRSSDSISVNIVSSGDTHTFRVNGNGYSGDVTIGLVFLSAGNVGTAAHYGVRYY